MLEQRGGQRASKGARTNSCLADILVQMRAPSHRQAGALPYTLVQQVARSLDPRW